MRAAASALSVERLCEVVAGGGVVVYPTETLWGIGGDARRLDVVERVARIKGISGGRPFPVLVDSVERALLVGGNEVPGFEVLVRRFWPGGLTLAIPVSDSLLASASGPFGTVGLRLSANGLATRLAAAAGGFLVSTSANFTGQPPASLLAEVDRRLLTETDGWPDEDVACGGVPSTVLEREGGFWVVRRAGAVLPEELAAVIPGTLRT